MLILCENFKIFDFFLKVPSLARYVPKPLKVPSLARSVPKPPVVEAGGLQTCQYHRCRPPTSLSSAARYEYLLPKLIVGWKVRGSTLQVNCEVKWMWKWSESEKKRKVKQILGLWFSRWKKENTDHITYISFRKNKGPKKHHFHSIHSLHFTSLTIDFGESYLVPRCRRPAG